jgi:hypothetical protein
MTPLDAMALFLILFLPLNWLVKRHFERLTDPAYLRQYGIVVQSESVLEARAEPIGEYLGHPIWATVTFMGLVYRFDHVIDSRKRDRIGPRELFLDPGLVYITE